MKSVPKQTGEIFEVLNKGQFICADSPNDNTRRLFKVLEEEFDQLYLHFESINFTLQAGDDYFHFTRKETKVDLERKIEIAFRWIDYLDFFKTFENSFGPGFRFTPYEIIVKLTVDAVLKSKLEGLKKHTKEDLPQNSIQKAIEMLAKDNFVELENEFSMSYKVLASFRYLEALVLKINIPDEVRNEIPE
jgi:hypothetical protein